MAPYQKEGVLKDGTRVILRPMVKEDRDGLLDFHRRLDEKDKLFLRHDVRDPAVIDHWVNNIDYQKVFPLLAIADGRIVGDATLHMRKVGWKRHVGNVRLVVAKDFQGRGLGTLLHQRDRRTGRGIRSGKADCRNPPAGPGGPDGLQTCRLCHQGGL